MLPSRTRFERAIASGRGRGKGRAGALGTPPALELAEAGGPGLRFHPPWLAGAPVQV